jgi:hypothetical protein
MGSSEAVSAKRLRDRHGREKRKIQQRNAVLRHEIERLHATHDAELAAARVKIIEIGDEMMDAVKAQAAEIKGFELARERLRRGFLARIRWALGAAWRGRFA